MKWFFYVAALLCLGLVSKAQTYLWKNSTNYKIEIGYKYSTAISSGITSQKFDPGKWGKFENNTGALVEATITNSDAVWKDSHGKSYGRILKMGTESFCHAGGTWEIVPEPPIPDHKEPSEPTEYSFSGDKLEGELLNHYKISKTQTYSRYGPQYNHDWKFVNDKNIDATAKITSEYGLCCGEASAYISLSISRDDGQTWNTIVASPKLTWHRKYIKVTLDAYFLWKANETIIVKTSMGGQGLYGLKPDQSSLEYKIEY